MIDSPSSNEERVTRFAKLRLLQRAYRIAYGQLAPEMATGATRKMLSLFLKDSARAGAAEPLALATMALDLMTLASAGRIRAAEGSLRQQYLKIHQGSASMGREG